MAQAVRTGPLRRDSGLACILYAVFFVLLVLVGEINTRFNVTPREKLVREVGRVEGAPWVTHGRGGVRAHVQVITPTGLRYLSQSYSPRLNGGMLGVRHGDIVTALVKPDIMARSNDAIWELQRGSETLVTYAQTREILEEENSTAHFMSWAGVAAAFGFLALGVFQRRKYGVWRIYLPYREFS